MRVRSSRGLRVEQYLWGSTLPGERDVDVPAIDADSAFVVVLKQVGRDTLLLSTHPNPHPPPDAAFVVVPKQAGAPSPRPT